MPNAEHLAILKQGVETWNAWRKKADDSITPGAYTQIEIQERGWKHVGDRWAQVDLSYADLTYVPLQNANLSRSDLTGADLRHAFLMGASLVNATLDNAKLDYANLSRANLMYATLRGASMYKIDLLEADLRSTNLDGADLRESRLAWTEFNEGASLRGARLRKASLHKADLNTADLTGADLREARLTQAILVDASFRHADLTGAYVYGISAWNLALENTVQQDLVITDPEKPTQPRITVDNIEVAQFLYLLLNNERVRHVIDTITSKVVLILGRFTAERKAVLDAVRDELRRRNYTPVMFDFDGPASRDITETISTLAHMARFLVADITDAKSIPEELMAVIPNLPSVPVQPLLQASSQEYGMFEHFRRFPWVLPICRYTDIHNVTASIVEKNH